MESDSLLPEGYLLCWMEYPPEHMVSSHHPEDHIQTEPWRIYRREEELTGRKVQSEIMQSEPTEYDAFLDQA